MRVLLIIPKFFYPDAAPVPELFPQGVAYVAGALLAAGHDVTGCNISYTRTRESAPELLRRALSRKIAAFQPQAIALGGLTPDYLFISDAIMICRDLAPDVPVILGGGIVTADQEFIFSNLRPDFAIAGEAEIPIVELLAAIETGGDMGTIGGLAFWRNGGPVLNPARPESKILPEYALPNYDVLDIEEFFQASSHYDADSVMCFHPRPRLFTFSAGRSCPFRCTFCFHSNGSIYKQRKISKVLEEIAHFKEKHDFNCFIMYDELFSVNEARVREFCDGMRALKMDLKWTCSMRVPDVTEDLLRDMKDAGCPSIALGLESASNVILTSMQKKITRKQIEAAVTAVEASGIGLRGAFIFGDPAETPETMKETINFILDNKRHIFSLGPILPTPGTSLFNNALSKNIIPSKKEYYETLHQGVFYNMTSIPTDQFVTLLRGGSDAFSDTMSLGHTEDLLFLVNRPARDLDEYPRASIVFKIQCPYCGEKMDRIYNYPKEANVDELISSLNDKRYLTCSSCSRVMIAKPGSHKSIIVNVVFEGRDVPTYQSLEKGYLDFTSAAQKSTPTEDSR